MQTPFSYRPRNDIMAYAMIIKVGSGTKTTAETATAYLL